MMGDRQSNPTRSSCNLRVQFRKHADGSVILSCTRADGSTTWQRHPPRHAVFFSFHDLTHFAVETALHFTHGFYGLIADGWDISETDGKGKRGRLPPEAVLVEHVVGLLDRERVGQAHALSAHDFNNLIREMVIEQNVRAFSEAELIGARARRDELHDQWAAVATGEVLELVFQPVVKNEEITRLS